MPEPPSGIQPAAALLPAPNRSGLDKLKPLPMPDEPPWLKRTPALMRSLAPKIGSFNSPPSPTKKPALWLARPQSIAPGCRHALSPLRDELLGAELSPVVVALRLCTPTNTAT